jgi:tetratricopeptide (TPR) repeat protein
MLICHVAFCLIVVADVLLGQAGSETINTIVSDLRSGKYVEAQQTLKDALRTAPTDPRLWTLNGFVLLHTGNRNEALASYEHALQTSENYLPALEGAAQIRYDASDQEAVPLLEKVLQLKPADETAHGMLGSLAFLRGDCATAATEFAQSWALTVSQPSALKQDAYCLLKLKRNTEALTAVRRLNELEPGNAKLIYNEALLEASEGNYHSVIAELEPLASRDARFLDLLSEAYEATSDTPRAVATLRQAIVLNPNEPDYYVDFANLCLIHASYQVGIDMVNTGLKRLPQSSPLYLARGILYIQMGRYEDAERDFAEAERLDPNSQLGSNAQGLALLQHSTLPEAEAMARSRIRQQPQNAFPYYLLAETIVRGGAAPGSPKFSEAVKAAEQAVTLDPKLAPARDVLGRLYLAEGKIDQAITQSRRAWEENPDDQTALYHLILALRKGQLETEIPPLAKELAGLRENLRVKEATERKYSLVEVAPPHRPATIEGSPK